jgi:proline racemase
MTSAFMVENIKIIPIEEKAVYRLFIIQPAPCSKTCGINAPCSTTCSINVDLHSVSPIKIV